MNHKNYPNNLFISGLITNIFFQFSWLCVPAIVLLIIGIWNTTCLFIGLALLVLGIVLSFIRQMQIRETFLDDTDNPDFQAFQEALSNDDNWVDNIKDLVNSKIEDNEQ